LRTRKDEIIDSLEDLIGKDAAKKIRSELPATKIRATTIVSNSAG
jgi:hypothetical protein